MVIGGCHDINQSGGNLEKSEVRVVGDAEKQVRDDPADSYSKAAEEKMHRCA